MSRCVALTILALSLSTAAAAPVRHPGEWETTVNHGPPRLVCITKEDTFDQNTLTRAMGKMPGASCTMLNFQTVGSVTSFTTQCTVQGSAMTTTGTLTQTGTDEFTSTAHSTAMTIKMPDGHTFNMPAMDITNVSRRIGPCKPGDRQLPQ